MFRQAYDILRKIVPSDNDGKNVIEVSRVVTDTESYNRVSNLSGWFWEDNLNWEITVSEECQLTEKQLLALCLWERTYYGFSPEKEREMFNMLDEELVDDVPEPDEMDKRRELIKNVCSNYHDLDANDIDFILTDKELISHTFVGLSDSQKGEIDYIKKSIICYSDIPNATGQRKCLALLCIPSKHNVSASDIGNLTEALSDKIGCKTLIFHQRFASDRVHISLTIIYI